MRFAPLVAVLLALVALTAPAAAGGAGSSGLRSGGAAFGDPLPVPDKRPVASRLTVTPRVITAGDPTPVVRLRVRQRGVVRVRARIVVVRLPGSRPVARKSLGRVRTGQALKVRLPKALMLQTGRYVVRLHVKDPRGRTLRRSAGHPGRARIVVRRPKTVPAPPPVLPGGPTPLVPEPAASPGGPGVFPIAGAFDFGEAGARFGAGRTGHVHEGQDIMAAAGTPIVAPYAGTISATSYQSGGAGEYVVLDATDGRDYFFAHSLRRSTVVAEGAAVSAGQPLCQVGATGTTSGAPHLHFEIWQVGWRAPGGTPIDPLPELRAWSGR
ncbi:MAG: peptidoglycan DD-metalloendopeptidase family protein [Solirubrobacteraceae bacterium]|nr:peptidoglycan DD-metalloendopeptidase family protein [Solirubrobacteraceae bacterium]